MTTCPKLEKKRAHIKGLIIQGTVSALLESGLSAVTMKKKIAAKAGVNTATLHYYFADKNALLTAAVQLIVSQISRELSANLGQQPDIRKCIEMVICNSWQVMARTRDIQLLQYELLLYTLRNVETQSIAKFQYDGYRKLYEDLFRHALADISPPGAIDLADLARFVVAGMDGLILQYLVDPDAEKNHCDRTGS
ncbi:TetR/AcrR family transcriptional regulator [Undibacterium arcticum]